jgi:hypothetical protein
MGRAAVLGCLTLQDFRSIVFGGVRVMVCARHAPPKTRLVAGSLVAIL